MSSQENLKLTLAVPASFKQFANSPIFFPLNAARYTLLLLAPKIPHKNQKVKAE